jgi:hypothetical protein
MTSFGPKRTRNRSRLLALVMAIAVSASIVPAAAAGEPAANQGPANPAASVSLSLDCSTVPDTSQARAALRRYHVCGKDGGGLSAMSSVTSDCGTLSLFVSNDFGGALQWRGRITSRLGPFVFGQYAGTWSNLTNGRSGPVGRSYVGATSDWLDVIRIGTGTGSVFGIIQGAVIRLWWGGYCTSTFPVDSHAIVT